MPSSVTIIRESDGHYHARFVVEAWPTPPRVEREKSRRARGGANRAKSRREVAVRHGKVARARRDCHHEQTLGLVRENHVIHVEDLNIAGVRNRRLARAISDAGWGQFVRLLEEKAERYGRTAAKVSRWLPSRKTCSHCGHVMDACGAQVSPLFREAQGDGAGSTPDAA